MDQLITWEITISLGVLISIVTALIKSRHKIAGLVKKIIKKDANIIRDKLINKIKKALITLKVIDACDKLKKLKNEDLLLKLTIEAIEEEEPNNGSTPIK